MVAVLEALRGGSPEHDVNKFSPGTPVQINRGTDDLAELGVTMTPPTKAGLVSVKYYGGNIIKDIPLTDLRVLRVEEDPQLGDYACVRMKRFMSLLRHTVVWGSINKISGEFFTVQALEDTGPGPVGKVTVLRDRLLATMSLRGRFDFQYQQT